MWSMPSTIRPRLCTIWTAVAPDAVRTRRTNEPIPGGHRAPSTGLLGLAVELTDKLINLGIVWSGGAHGAGFGGDVRRGVAVAGRASASVVGRCAGSRIGSRRDRGGRPVGGD